MFLFKKGPNKQLILNIGLPSAIFVIVGGILFKYINSFLLEIILGLFLIGFSLMFLIKI